MSASAWRSGSCWASATVTANAIQTPTFTTIRNHLSTVRGQTPPRPTLQYMKNSSEINGPTLSVQGIPGTAMTVRHSLSQDDFGCVREEFAQSFVNQEWRRI